MASLVLYWADYRMDLLSVTFSHMKQALETAKSTAITLYQEASKLHTEHRQLVMISVSVLLTLGLAVLVYRR